MMEKDLFEGSLVLEQLAETGKLDEFYEAIDRDDFSAAKSLMIAAGLDKPTIKMVIRKMQDADGTH